MSRISISMRDASHRLTHYATRAAAGDEFVITRHGKALARLVPMETEAAPDEAAVKARERQIARALAVRAARPYPRQRFERADAYED